MSKAIKVVALMLVIAPACTGNPQKDPRVVDGEVTLDAPSVGQR